MAKSSYVLQALSILGLEEMLKLSEVLRTKQMPLKKAAGQELIVWDDDPTGAEREPIGEAKVLAFPQKSLQEEPRPISHSEHFESKSAEEVDAKEEGPPNDLLLWQREISRDRESALLKLDAIRGYQKSTQTYVVKSQSLEGQEKIRFAATSGVLINKRQA